MSYTLRFAVASCAVVATLLAWWFPAPVLIRGELVDWGRLYEAQYAPPSEMMFSVIDLTMARLKAGAEPVPLTEFIAGKTDGHTFRATDAAWAEVFSRLDTNLAPNRPLVRFFKPTQPPFVQLDDKLRYVEWRDGRGIRYLEYQYILAKEFKDQPIPEAIRFPLRAYWPYLLCGVLAIGYWGFFPRRTLGIVESSWAGKGFRISAAFTIAFLGIILWPFIYQNMGSNYFGVILVGGILLLGAGLFLLYFRGQISALRRMIEDRQYLARFTYGIKEWNQFIEWRFAEESSTAKFGLVVISIIFGVVSLGFVVLEQDETSLCISGGLMGFIVLFGGLGMVMQRLAYRRNRLQPGEVYVGESGCYINGSVHTWRNYLEKAEFKIDPVPHILVAYSQPSRNLSRSLVSVPIPVPMGQEPLGRRVVDQLMETRVRRFAPNY
jgi:hypothetical protein